MPLRRDPEGNEPRYLHDYLDFTAARVLEVGCGDGRMTWGYAASAAKVIGLDVEFDKLTTALTDRPPELCGSTRFMQASAVHLPFRNRVFDHIILAWSM